MDKVNRSKILCGIAADRHDTVGSIFLFFCTTEGKRRGEGREKGRKEEREGGGREGGGREGGGEEREGGRRGKRGREVERRGGILTC